MSILAVCFIIFIGIAWFRFLLDVFAERQFEPSPTIMKKASEELWEILVNKIIKEAEENNKRFNNWS